MLIFMVEERLFSESIARDEQLMVPSIRDRKGKHPEQLLGQTAPPLPVSVQEHFGVRLCSESMAARDQFLTQLDVVVDLSVEGDDEIALVGRHRLVSVRQIDNRQSAMPKDEIAVVPKGAVVGAAVPYEIDEGTPHLDVRCGRPRVSVREITEDAAHARRPI